MQTTTHINPASTPLGSKFNQLEPDSITLEEGDLLYALVRMRKPHLCIETGTGHGFGTRRIVDALKANGEGELISCDIDADYVYSARDLFQSETVNILKMSGTELLSILYTWYPRRADLIFVDAGNAVHRMMELDLILDKDLLSKEGTLVIHDTHKEQYKPLVDYVHMYGWKSMIFDTLAGIAVFQHP